MFNKTFKIVTLAGIIFASSAFACGGNHGYYNQPMQQGYYNQPMQEGYYNQPMQEGYYNNQPTMNEGYNRTGFGGQNYPRNYNSNNQMNYEQNRNFQNPNFNQQNPSR